MPIVRFVFQGLWSGLLLRSCLALQRQTRQARPAPSRCTCEPLELRTLASVGLPIVSVRAGASAYEQNQKPGTIVLSRSGDVTQALQVNWQIENTGTAGEADFQNLPTSATIPAGAKSVTVMLTPVDDFLPEGSETLRLTLQPGGNFVLSSKPSKKTASLRVVDNEPTVSVRAVDKRASEGGNNPGVFRFSRTGPTDTNLTVNFSIPQDAAGDVTVGDDFANPGSFIVIPAGSRSVDLLISPTDDNLAEGTERLTMFLEDGNYFWGTDEAEILINDNEFVPLASVRATDSQSTEHADTGTWTITLSSPALQNTPIYFTFSGSAVNGTDFVELDNYVIIPQGQTQATITLNPYEDFIDEGTQTTALKLALGTGYNVSTKYNKATIRIYDPASDLTLLSVSNPSSLTADVNAVLPVTIDVYNRGYTPSGPFYVSIVLASLLNVNNPNYVEYQIGEIDISEGLSAGYAAYSTLTTPIATVPEPGYYRVIITLDSRDEVTELNELNNTFYSPTTVRVI